MPRGDYSGSSGIGSAFIGGAMPSSPNSGGGAGGMTVTQPSPTKSVAITDVLNSLHELLNSITNSTGSIESALGIGTEPYAGTSKDKDVPNVLNLSIAAVERAAVLANRLARAAASL